MPIKLQPKLLRVLQTGEVQRVGSSQVRFVNVRVIAATNADLHQAIATGQFREDLFYRINTVEIHLPPLRDRREDVEPLAAHFLARYALRYRKPLEGFDAEAHKALGAYTWPGNVRELAHAVERAVLMADPSAKRIQAADLALRGQLQTAPATGLDDLALEEIERLFIKKAIARHGGDIRRAAAQLGLSRSALYRRLQHYEETGE
jgi:transcriptional regulator with PAS, ATPase and Fis domain